MPDFRAMVESDLAVTLEGDWGAPVALIDPGGVRHTETVDGRPLRGQVLYNIVRTDVETGERVTADTPVVTLRRSSLNRVPAPGETWIVEAPGSPLPGAPMVQFAFSPDRPPEGGAAIGFIRLYLQRVEQSDEPEQSE